MRYKVWHSGLEDWIHDKCMMYIDPDGDVYEIDTSDAGYMYKNCMTDFVKVVHSTQMNDREGKEIYERDIVSEPYFSNVNPLDRNDNDYLDTEDRKYVICYDTNQAKYKAVPVDLYLINSGQGGWTGYEVRSERFTVIGHVFQNPELLKGE